MADITDNISRRLRQGDAALWIVAINVAVYLLLVAAGVVVFHSIDGASAVGAYLGVPSSPAALARMPWTPLSYMFTQVNLLHLLFNMLWLWWFSRVVAFTLTQRHLAAIYIFGGIAGTVVYLLPPIFGYQPGGGPLLGSSASVLAVMTVAAFRSPDTEFNLFLIGRVKLKWIAIVCIALSFIGLGGGAGRGQMAHVGGVALGLIAGLAYRSGHDIFKWCISASPRNRISKRRARKAFSNAVGNEEDLNRLLDKIRISGYGSLSRRERNELQILSRKLKQ